MSEKNIYQILGALNFSSKSKEIYERLGRISTREMDEDAREYLVEQVLFEFAQQLYEKILEEEN